MGFPFHSWYWQSVFPVFINFVVFSMNQLLALLIFSPVCFLFHWFLLYYFLPLTYFELVLCPSISYILRYNLMSLILDHLS